MPIRLESKGIADCGTYNTDISCYRIVPYTLGAEVLFDLQQIIPLPEARDFQIQQRQEGAATSAARAENNSRDYTRYDVAVGDALLRGVHTEKVLGDLATIAEPHVTLK